MSEITPLNNIKKQKLSLKDFYFEEKYAAGTHMQIKMPDGTDSGEWLNIVSPEADAAVKAMRAYLQAYRMHTQHLEPLRKQCEDSGDFTDYNISLGEACSGLNHDLAVEIVNGWSFDETFSREALNELLVQYKALANDIADFHTEQRRKLSEK